MKKRKSISFVLALALIMTSIFTLPVFSMAGDLEVYRPGDDSGDGAKTQIHLSITNLSDENISSVTVSVGEKTIPMKKSGGIYKAFDDKKYVTNDISGFTVFFDRDEDGVFFEEFEAKPEAGGTINCSLTINPTSLTIVKAIDGDEPENDSTFRFTIQKGGCNKTVEIVGEGSSESILLSAGDYIVTEDPVESYTVDQATKTINVVRFQNNRLTFINTYTAPDSEEPTHASLTIRKDVYNQREELINELVDDVFQIAVIGDDYTTEVAISAGGVITLNNLTPGEYTISEAAIDNYYIPNAVDVEISEGEDEAYTIDNMYLGEGEPNPEPTFVLEKTVAEYTGAGMPSSFVEELTLGAIGKQVIYKIDFSWNQANLVGSIASPYISYHLEDLLNFDDGGDIESSYIEDELLTYSGGEFSTLGGIAGFPDSFQLPDGFTFYYIDTVDEEGTYTNTVELYESYPFSAMLYAVISEPSETSVASDSAVVIVDVTEEENPGDDDDDDTPFNPPASRNNVTYHANFPTGAVTTGSVPTDSTNYSDGATVTVKNNTGSLTAEGYTFLGWDLKADGSGTDYASGDTFKIYNDINLYGRWDPVAVETNTQTDPSTSTDGTTEETTTTNALDPVPKTGDNTPIVPIALLGLTSAGIFLALIRRRAA